MPLFGDQVQKPWSSQDEARFKRVRLLSRLLDEQFRIPLIRQIPWSEAHAAEPEVLLTREWLVTNGLGGYAAGTFSGIPTRRYHGFLVAALPAPFGRMMLLPQLSEQLRLPDGTIVRLGGEERAGTTPQLYGAQYFSEFRLEERRGYEHTGDLWSPGYFRVDLSCDRTATLVASTESWAGACFW